MTTRVIIVRHGQSNYNVEKRIQGRSDKSVLTEQGKQDAELLGKTLKNYNVSAIYSSPLKRAVATAEVIQNCWENPPSLQTLEQLKEMCDSLIPGTPSN